MPCGLPAHLAFCIRVLSATLTAADLPTAAEKQDWHAVSTQLTAKADVNATQADGTTAMHWAAYHDKAEVIAKLLSAGAKPDEKNRYGITPLLLACENGNERIVRALLKAGAKADVS